MTHRVRSIQYRLTAQYTMIFAVLLVLFGGLLTYSLYTSLQWNIDWDLEDTAQRIQKMLHIENGQPVLLKGPDELLTEPELHRILEYVQISDARGNLIKQSAQLQLMGLNLDRKYLQTLLRERVQFSESKGARGGSIRFINVPLYDAQGQQYLLQIGFPLGPIYDSMDQFVIILAIWTPAVLALALLGGWLMARRTLRPVGEIAAAARQITASNLALRIGVRGSNDELDQLAATFNQMIARLENSFDQIRQFTANVSHELRTPLTAMQGETELALMSPSTGEDLRRTLESNLEEISRMSRMVNDLLTLAQAEAGEIRLDFAPVALDALAADLVDQMRPLAEEKGVRLETGTTGRVVALGNEPRLRQLVLNLLDNAIKYTPAGGRIRVAVSLDDASAVFAVSDTGIGIPEDDLPRIFERFYRVDRARSKTVEGVGLGLSIAKWIVDAHGGQMKVYSTPGQGTTFRIQFPLAPPSARLAAEPTHLTAEAR